MSGNAYTSIRTEGALFTPDFLQGLTTAGGGLGGLTSDSYHLTGEQVHEAASRSWNRLIGAWTGFRASTAALVKGDAATTVTRERWLLPLFVELGFGRLQAARAIEIDGRSYPVSHAWHHVPLHLVGCGVSLDTRTTGVAGAARTSPHGLLQELLNRSDGMLWGVLSNGLTLRLLRDNRSLTRQAYVEFDLVAMMDGQAYADFVVLWLLCHQSRFEGERPEDCWLERWATDAHERGTRILDDLRDAVERAIAALGRGFLAHPANRGLLEQLRTGALDRQDYYRQLLRVVYRLIFLFVAEDRELLLAPTATATARDRYHRYYSASRLRNIAAARRGTPHADLWTSLEVVFRALGSDDGCQELGLPALGSFLWRHEAVTQLESCSLANADLLDAVRALGFRIERNVRQLVNWRSLGPEELGSVYESLLELHPDVNTSAGTFTLTVAPGHERKTTGSYYTPTSLIECLLDSALDPVLDTAAKQVDPAHAILALRVCDPACGSGHFLIAAGHRIATRLASVRTGEPEPAPTAVRTAVRDVISHCLYGVDVNPMAVELCKVNLWLEALEPGRPLSFLDHHIQCGNALLGATPSLMARGVLDEAFEPVEGDDRDVAKRLKQRNVDERKGQSTLFDLMAEPLLSVTDEVATQAALLEHTADDDIGAVRAKELQWERLSGSPEYQDPWFQADTWCATFFWPKEPGEREHTAITHDLWLRICADPAAAPTGTRTFVREIARRHRFFHWHLAFPTVFTKSGSDSIADGTASSRSGFDVLIGNPPWERVSVKEREFFAGRENDIATETNSKTRAALIKRLNSSEPTLYDDFQTARDSALRTKSFLSKSGRFPLTGVGDINTHALFAELGRDFRSSNGRAGLVVQTQLVTEKTYSDFTKDLVTRHQIVSCYAFENERKVFPGAHHSTRFILLTLGNGSETIEMASGLFEVAWLSEPVRRYRLTASDIERMNPFTFALPQFRSSRDADTAAHLHAKHSSLRWEEGFRSGLTISRVLHDKDDAAAISWDALDSVEHGRIPVLESKLFSQYNHRFATFAGESQDAIRAGRPARTGQSSLEDPAFSVTPRKWIHLADTPDRFQHFGRKWLLHIRKIARNIDIRTAIAAITPKWPNNGSCAWVRNDWYTTADYLFLTAVLNSFVYDYLLRQKVAGANVNAYQLFQVPVPRFPSEGGGRWHFEAAARAFQLSYSAIDLEALAADAGWRDNDHAKPPFAWSLTKRAQLRYELDAIVARLYGVSQEEFEWILDARPPSESFRVLRESEEQEFGEFVTKTAVLQAFSRSWDVAMDAPFPSDVVPMDLVDVLRVRHLAEQRALMPLYAPPTDDPVKDGSVEKALVPHVAPPAVVGLPTLDELRNLPTRVWALQANDWTEAALPVLAAVLKSQHGPTPSREVRLVSVLALEPRLLTPFLDASAAAEWLRLVGQDAAPLPSGVHALAPKANTTWGAAVRQLRGTGRLIEDAAKNTWSAGPGLEDVDTTTWPDGRARFVWWAIGRRGLDVVVAKLPDAVRAWVNAEAA